MKHSIAFLLLLLGLVSQVYAQDSVKKKWVLPVSRQFINPKIGLTQANFHSLPDRYSANAITRWCFGSDFRFGKRLYVQPGAFYKKEGSMLFFTDGRVEQSTKLLINSLNLRTLVGYAVIEKPMYRVRVHAGPSFDLSLKQFIYKSFGTEPIEQWLSDNMVKVEAGAGLDFWRLTFDVHYAYALTDAFTEKIKASGQFIGTRLNGFTASVGILFPLEKQGNKGKAKHDKQNDDDDDDE